MKQETKDLLRDKSLAVLDWIEAHPWPVVSFIAGFLLGWML